MQILVTIASIAGGLAALGYFVEKAHRWYVSLPAAELKYRGDNPPILCVEVYNRSNTTPLHIHRVRICFGQHDYCHTLVLTPRETITIQPKGKHSFELSYDRASVERFVTRRELHRPDIPPTFDGPPALFMAIANGPRPASWLWIQYNNDQFRTLHKGKIKQTLQTMLEIGRRRALT